MTATRTNETSPIFIPFHENNERLQKVVPCCSSKLVVIIEPQFELVRDVGCMYLIVLPIFSRDQRRHFSESLAQLNLFYLGCQLTEYSASNSCQNVWQGFLYIWWLANYLSLSFPQIWPGWVKEPCHDITVRAAGGGRSSVGWESKTAGADGQLTNTSSALLHFHPFLTLKERQQELARYAYWASSLTRLLLACFIVRG